jgi:hypothetical protein
MIHQKTIASLTTMNKFATLKTGPLKCGIFEIIILTISKAFMGEYGNRNIRNIMNYAHSSRNTKDKCI